MTKQRRLIQQRRLVLVPLAVAAVVLAFASVAYACTTITGTITTTLNGTTCSNSTASCTVHPGDTISSTATGLTRGGPYWSLYFLNYKSTQDSMNTCMSNVPGAEQKIAGPVQSSSGQVSGSGQIPVTAQPSSTSSTPTGPALVCWLTSDAIAGAPDYVAATPPTELDVL